MPISTYSAYSDGELLMLLRSSDKLAFAELYDRYNKPLYRYVVSLVKAPEAAEDIVHEVFLKIWEIREKLEIKEHFRGYLFRICHNKTVDLTRRMATERRLKDRLRHHYLLNLSAAEGHSLKELEHYDNLIDKALNTLSPARRRVFELHRKQGKSHADIAEELQISPNTVKEHMSKALSTLRNFLEQGGEVVILLLIFRSPL